MRPSIIIGCTNGSLYALATMLPFVMMSVVGLTPTQFGLGMLAQSGSFLAGSLLMRRLLRTVPAHRLVPIGLGFVAAGGLLLAVFMHLAAVSFLTVMGPVGLIAFGIAFTMPSMMTESLAPFPEIAGAASALTGFMQMGGGLFGSAAAAAMGEPVLALGRIIPVMALIAVVAYLALKPFVPKREELRADRQVKPDVEGDGA
jgi:DHA1 family bicyclomycin/chloramphenicol resistance-like MFS transporter